MPDLRATYRLQLSPDLDFAAVKALAPYLRDLGVSHLYLSPSLTARSGSTHGYDVVDPTTVSEALGGEAGLRALAAEADLGLILDIVPNHMGTGDENRWWSDPDERTKVFDVDPETGFYRRFFDIDDLAAVRQEDADVFELTHSKTLELIADGVVDGVRADHPDGLADPAGYTRRLREHGAKHVWLEKILHPGEPLRDWPVDGTVGYEFANDAQAAFVDTDAEGQFTRLWTELSGDQRDFAQHARDAQIELATTTFQRELDWLHRLAPQFDTDTLAAALADLPVYRTYVEPWSGTVAERDRQEIEAAGMPAELAAALLLEGGDELDAFVTRFQQTSPPVTAKGIEDTAFYRYNRLLALNEVGGDPGRFGIDVGAFHAGNAERATRFPRNLLVSTTHDTKRSADVRARIGALTQPALRDPYEQLARKWVPAAPDATSGFLVLQTLLGAHPIEADRLDPFLEKALREAKQRTNWVDQDTKYEAAVKAWAQSLLADEGFRADFDPLLERAVIAGRHSALGQLALKLTSPGIPDVYGGDELEYLALVDPDNRRPVDFDLRREALAAAGDGRHPKLDLIHAVLDLRKRHQNAFEDGAYEPVDVGPDVVAFLRGEDILVVVPTHEAATGTLRGGFGGEWHEILTAANVALRDGMEVAGHGPGIYERI